MTLQNEPINRNSRTKKYCRFKKNGIKYIDLEMRRQAFCRRVHIREIGITIATTRRCSDRDEHEIGMLDSRTEIGGKTQAAF